MAKKITVKQLKDAIAHSPTAVAREGKVFLQRGLAEYKRIAVQGKPWRVGQSGGGIPRDSNNLRERHYTRIRGLEGRFGVDTNVVRYASYVHGFGSKPVKVRGKNIETRPWLNYAKSRGEKAVEKHYNHFMDKILEFIAS